MIMLRSMPNRSLSLMPSLKLSPSPIPVPSPKARRRLPASRLPKTSRPASTFRKRTGSITLCHRPVPIGATERAVLRPVLHRRPALIRCRGRPSTFRSLTSKQLLRTLPSRRRRLLSRRHRCRSRLRYSSRSQERNSRCLNSLCSHSPFRNRMQSRSRPS